MKAIFVFLLATSTSALAAPIEFTCKAQKDAKNDSSAPYAFELSLDHNDAIYWIQGQRERAQAERDATYEKRNPGSDSVMFAETSSYTPFVSDIGVHLFVPKKMLRGESGVVGVSTGQPNDGDSGPANLWYTVHYSCKAK